MNLDDIIKNLRATAFALDNLQVKGRDNLDILLGSMQQIDRAINSLSKFQKDLNESFKIDVEPAEEEHASAE